MTQTTKKRIQVQVDRSLADEGDAVLSELGLTPTTAITMFYKRLVAQGTLPFPAELTQREKDELDIQKLTADWPVKDLKTPEEIKDWAEKDD
ncbi:type II toxin-antitoxin system RelB/DinJ family antitoxin [Levilactobacillus namurensis]|uniref:type II toxin-antitoxin system RelB/DinJ family antitoxin n=1 Tax=Levilactobacillus namurensis TaxID=380393 RepID=UPI001E0BE1C2|nr:type II toxin-antitoxin system RelB/DinJ family antitoxin [Levilactobacillus namurensis]HJE45740.1 type II toxin-antitoxin system RelB/DinJ family antitoxin [Levilactobacillus namurensis]